MWSPTFALTLFDNIIKHKLELVSVLASGKWGDRSPALPGLKCPQSHRVAELLLQWQGNISAVLLKQIWPELALVSAWDTSSSATWANKLQNLLPQAEFQGKGLWATEGVVTIPFQNNYPLAICSHFYEFIDLDTDEVFPAWQLEKDQVVRPVLTTGSGLLRYAMKDKLRVSGFLHNFARHIPQINDAKSRVKAAEADLRLANIKLERAVIKAPFSGRVKTVSVGRGQLVNSGEIIGEIYALDKMHVRLPVADKYLTLMDLPFKVS